LSKDYTCEADYSWIEDKDGEVSFPNGTTLPVSIPGHFGGDDSKLDPEELLAGAVNSCISVTMLGVLRRAGAPIDAVVDYQARAEGSYGKGESGLEFKEFVVVAEFVVEDESAAGELRTKIESNEIECLVTETLNVPTRLETTVQIQEQV